MSELYKPGVESRLIVPGSFEVVVGVCAPNPDIFIPEREGTEFPGLSSVSEMIVTEDADINYVAIYMSALNCRGFGYRYDPWRKLVRVPPFGLSANDQVRPVPMSEKTQAVPDTEYKQSFLEYLLATNRVESIRT